MSNAWEFFGEITTESSVMPDRINLLVTMTIQFSDKMTIISATHIPGSYNESSIVFKNNPYGENGQFRTITNNYDIKVTRIVPIVKQAGPAAPTTLTSPNLWR